MECVTQRFTADHDGFDQESTGCVLRSDSGGLERRCVKPCPFSIPQSNQIKNLRK